MMGIREKLERALMRTAWRNGVPDQHVAPVLQEEIDVILDAFLDALSEPDDEMIERGRAAWLETASDYNLLAKSVANAYRAMIDQARGRGR